MAYRACETNRKQLQLRFYETETSDCEKVLGFVDPMKRKRTLLK